MDLPVTREYDNAVLVALPEQKSVICMEILQKITNKQLLKQGKNKGHSLSPPCCKI